MKLVKLSLAVVVAAGSFSFANAVALDEAIQNVDVSGILRYRYDSNTTKTGKAKNHSGTQAHKYKAVLKLSADIADNFKATAVMQYKNADKSYGKDAALNTDKTFNLRDAYLTYTNYDTSFMFGRMQIDSIWTDDLLGTGLKVVNNSIEGITLAAYAFDNFNNDEDLSSALVLKNGNASAKNLYGIAAIANFDPVAAQLWVAYKAAVGTFYAVDFNVALGDADDFAYNIHAQYAGNSLKSEFKGGTATNGSFYGIEAGFDAFGVDFNIGYLAFGKKDKITVNSIEDTGSLINYGEIVMKDYQGGMGKKDYIFGTIGYTYDDVRFGVDIISGTNKFAAGKEKLFEVKPQLSYQYSERLGFKAFYAYGKTDDVKGKANSKEDKKTNQITS